MPKDKKSASGRMVACPPLLHGIDSLVLKTALKPFADLRTPLQLREDVDAAVRGENRQGVLGETEELGRTLLGTLRRGPFHVEMDSRFPIFSFPWSQSTDSKRRGTQGRTSSSSSEQATSTVTLASLASWVFQADDGKCGADETTALESHQRWILQALRGVAIAVDILLAQAAAALKSEAVMDGSLPDRIPRVVPDDGPLVHAGLTLLWMCCANGDRSLHDACTCASVDSMLSVLMSDVVPPSGGMHRIESTQRQVANLHSVLRSLGLINPKAPVRARKDISSVLVDGLPLFASGASGVRSVLYVDCILAGQRKLMLNPVFRGDVLQSATESVLGVWGAPTWTAFPVFHRRETGAERGEGHGLRKEFFDSIAQESLADFALPDDITDYVRLRQVSPPKAKGLQRGTIAWAVEWSDPRARDVCRVGSGDQIELFFPGDDGLVSSTFTIIATATGESERQAIWTVMKASAAGDSIDLLAVQKAIVRKKRLPYFAVPAGLPYCWLNPSLPDEASASRLQQLEAFGACLAAGVANGVVVPVPLAPLFFRLLQSSDVEAVLASPTTWDLELAFPGASAEIEAFVALPQHEYEAVLEAEGLSLSTKRSEYVSSYMIRDRLFPPHLVKYLHALLKGFRRLSAGVPSMTHAMQRLPPESCVEVFCGVADDGLSDFRFSETFEFRFGDEMSETSPLGAAFRAVLFRVIDDDFDPARKRSLMMFVTGRKFLPPRRRSERITVEFPHTAFSAKQLAWQRKVLPTAHSCDNVLELPNYLDAILFDSDGLWYDFSGTKPTGSPSQAFKLHSWEAMPPDIQQAASELCRKLLRRKLLFAVEHSSGYELDEISQAQRGAATDAVALTRFAPSVVTTPPSRPLSDHSPKRNKDSEPPQLTITTAPLVEDAPVTSECPPAAVVSESPPAKGPERALSPAGSDAPVSTSADLDELMSELHFAYPGTRRSPSS